MKTEKDSEVVPVGSIQSQEVQTIQTADIGIQLIQQAISTGASMEQVEKLMDLQDRWEAKAARKSFYAALSKFQSLIPVITKKGHADFESKDKSMRVSYSWATLDDIASAIRPHLKDCGLSYRYEQENDKGVITVTCVVTHADGHEERAEMTSTADGSGTKNPIQAIASTVSYLRRYTLTGSLGITCANEDDDGEGTNETTSNDDFFDSNFPMWEQTISSGKNTKEALFNFITEKAFVLTPAQIAKINSIKVAK